MNQVFRVRIDFLKHFAAEEEQVEEHGIGHELSDLPDRFVLDFKGRRFFKDLKENNHGKE